MGIIAKTDYNVTFVNILQKQSVLFIVEKKENMETKEVKIECPEGYVIDNENSTFEKIVFKKEEKKLPKTWDEYFEATPPIEHNFHLDGYGVPKQYEKAFVALNKLICLRDVYNEGWKPAWNNPDQKKYSIYYHTNYVYMTFRENSDQTRVLTFKSEYLCHLFYENFRDIIEQAKELL